MGELKKVVWPTGEQTGQYFVVVLVFVLFIMAVVIFAAGTLLGALAVNFPMLLAARLVMSLGTGISLPLITNIHWHEEA